MTSHDVVNRVRRATGERRVGHAGTLDPFATGLLIVAVGREKTKTLGQYLGMDKTYEATLILGATSDTFDKDGVIVQATEQINEVDREAIESVLSQFRGGYDQLAPLYSAKKLAGKKLYELARKGSATEDMRPMKHVDIPRIDILDFAWPRLKLSVDCSSGTYIRSLADDIGRALGTGAYLEELRRTRIGDFSVNTATTLDNLSASC